MGILESIGMSDPKQRKEEPETMKGQFKAMVDGVIESCSKNADEILSSQENLSTVLDALKIELTEIEANSFEEEDKQLREYFTKIDTYSARLMRINKKMQGLQS